jgi:hypothetical protein
MMCRRRRVVAARLQAVLLLALALVPELARVPVERSPLTPSRS